MTRFAGKLAISLMFDGFVACLAAALVLWVRESLPACASLWRDMAASGVRLDAPKADWRHRCLEAWCFDARMQYWLGGWLGLAGWLQLAGCR